MFRSQVTAIIRWQLLFNDIGLQCNAKVISSACKIGCCMIIHSIYFKSIVTGAIAPLKMVAIPNSSGGHFKCFGHFFQLAGAFQQSPSK